jgi:hypothetical protein
MTVMPIAESQNERPAENFAAAYLRIDDTIGHRRAPSRPSRAGAVAGRRGGLRFRR